MSARVQEQELIIDDLTKQRNKYEDELREKRREVIDLTAELDRARRKINELEKNFNELVYEQTDYENRMMIANEAWQEKVDSLELELGTKHIYNWYLKPIFMFCAGATTAIVAVTWWIRWYL